MIADLHQDVAYYYMTAWDPPPFDADTPGRHSDMPKLARAGVGLVFAAVFPFRRTYGGWAPSLEDLLDAVKIYHVMARRHGIGLVRGPGDLDGRGLRFLLALEGADVLREPEDLLWLRELGVRSVGVTWNLSNRWGSSCMAREDRGLTEDGARLVEEAQRLGLLVDLAHAGERTALDVLSMARRPVVVSHANVRAVHSHPRNVSDAVLEGLRRVRGVLGLTLIPSTIGREPTLKAWAQHAKYVRDHYGADLLAIGTDFHGTRTPPEVPDVAHIGRLLDALRDAGFTEAEVEAVAWRNVERVLREAL